MKKEDKKIVKAKRDSMVQIEISNLGDKSGLISRHGYLRVVPAIPCQRSAPDYS